MRDSLKMLPTVCENKTTRELCTRPCTVGALQTSQWMLTDRIRQLVEVQLNAFSCEDAVVLCYWLILLHLVDHTGFWGHKGHFIATVVARTPCQHWLVLPNRQDVTWHYTQIWLAEGCSKLLGHECYAIWHSNRWCLATCHMTFQ